MPVERSAAGASLIDVLDRVLDKGIVFDTWVRVSLIGIDLVTVEARVVVASIETDFKYSELLAHRTPSTFTVKTVAMGDFQVQLTDRVPLVAPTSAARHAAGARLRSKRATHGE